MCADAWAPFILCSWCSMPNSWRTSYRLYLSVDLLPSVAKSSPNANPLWQRWLQSTKHRSILFTASPAELDDWTVKKKQPVHPDGLLKSWSGFPATYMHNICHTVISCGIIKKKKFIWCFSSGTFLSPLITGDSSTISSVWIKSFQWIWCDNDFCVRVMNLCSVCAPSDLVQICICLLNIVFGHNADRMHQNNPEFIMHILLTKAEP